MPNENLMALGQAGEALPRVGRRAFRDAMATTMAQVHEGGAVEITYENAREAVLIDAQVFDDLSAQVRASTHVRDGLRLALTAAAAGVRLPGELLEPLGLEVDEDALKRFRSVYPIRILHDEDGQPLPATDALSAEVHDVFFAEDEGELEFIDD